MRELTLSEMTAVSGGLRDIPDNDRPATGGGLGDVGIAYADGSTGDVLTDDFGNAVSTDSMGNLTSEGFANTAPVSGNGDSYVLSDGTVVESQTPTDPAFGGAHNIGDVVTDAQGHTYVETTATDAVTGQSTPFWQDITAEVNQMKTTIDNFVANSTNLSPSEPTYFFSASGYLGVGGSLTVSYNGLDPLNMDNYHLYIGAGFGIGGGIEDGVSTTSDLSGLSVGVSTPLDVGGSAYINDNGQLTGGTVSEAYIGTPEFYVNRSFDVNNLTAPDFQHIENNAGLQGLIQELQQMENNLHPAI